MPLKNGFEVLESIPENKTPYVIFITAYDEFALKAFEYNALDYLLKPYSDQRFYKSVEKALSFINNAHRQTESIQKLLETIHKPKTYRKRLPIKIKDRILLINVEDIHWIKASDGYLEINASGKKYLLHDSLKNLERQLDPLAFIRIHRSTIVNVTQIHALEPYFNGEYTVVLKDNERLKLSRNYKEKVSIILDAR